MTWEGRLTLAVLLGILCIVTRLEITEINYLSVGNVAEKFYLSALISTFLSGKPRFFSINIG